MINTSDKKVIAFDLDDTLSRSKSIIQSPMVKLLCELLKHKYVAVLSGANFEQFNKQFISKMDCSDLNKLYILPVKGSQLYKYEHGEWIKKFSYTMSSIEKETVYSAIYDALKKYGFDFNQKTYGELIQDKVSGITFSARGGDAPLEIKEVWDPDHSKREKIVKLLNPYLPDFNVAIGGTTSIDITPKGIDKAFGIKKLSEIINIPLNKFLFIGDALYPGGNDESVKRIGIDTIAVDGQDGTVEDTGLVIKKILEGNSFE